MYVDPAASSHIALEWHFAEVAKRGSPGKAAGMQSLAVLPPLISKRLCLTLKPGISKLVNNIMASWMRWMQAGHQSLTVAIPYLS